MLFLPNDDKLAEEARDIVQHVVAKEGRCRIKAWRDVPVEPSVVGRMAELTEPRIVQVTAPSNQLTGFFCHDTALQLCNFAASAKHGCHP